MMRLLRARAEAPPPVWTAAAIDERIRELFLGPSGEGDTNLQFVRDMLTKKAFNREAVLAAYEEIRSGARVPDKELDQVTSWLKLSGIVRRQDGRLRVRNAIYEQVFDQRWARVHRKLHINWRRRLARAAAVLLVLIVLVTIPLAVYATLQKQLADSQRSDAEQQRANAEAQRDLARQQLLTTEQNLRTAQEAVAALKTFDPKAAAQLSAELTTARTVADQQMAALTKEREGLLREREGAQARVKVLEQENAALRQGQQRPPAAAVAPATAVATVSVPNVVGTALDDVDRTLRAAGLNFNTSVLEGDQPRGTIVRQSPNAGTDVVRGSAILLSVSAGPAAPVRPSSSGTALDDTQQVLRTLQRYKAAYEARDAKAVAAVYPSVEVARLQAAFNEFSTWSYDLRLAPDGVVIAADGLSASVTASETTRLTAKVGGKDQQTGTAVFTMRKSGGAWTIQGIKSDTRN
jgi:hypothetical protein